MKKFIVLFVFVFTILSVSLAYDEIDISKFNKELEKYGNELFPELQNKNVLEEFAKGNINVNTGNIFSRILNLFFKELKENISIILRIVGIVLICSILKNMQNSFGDNNVSEIAFYVCYVLVVILIITSFSEIITVCKTAVKNLNNFMNISIPILIALLLIGGNITTVSMLQPVLITMGSMVTAILSNFVMPIILVSLIINIISNISNKINVMKLGNLLKKVALWVIEIVLIIFIGILSLEGTLSSSVDGITAKTAKSVVTSTVPVVGKLLGDAVDSVIGGTVITKNAVGLIGTIIIICITIAPILKTFILMLVFNVSSALIEPIADERISKCMSAAADTIKILLRNNGVYYVFIYNFYNSFGEN